MVPLEKKWSSRARRIWWSRIRPGWLKIEWPLIWFLSLASLLLGYVGFREHYATVGDPHTVLDLIYFSLQLFLLESGSVSQPVPWQLEVARFLAPAVTIYTATKAFLRIFRDQLVVARLGFYRGHIVIAGLGRMGFLLTRTLRRSGRRVVVLERDEDNDNVERCREIGAPVLIGNATDRALLRKARTARASHLISVLGDDGANAEVAGRVRELVDHKRESALTCLIHIIEPQLRNLLTQRQLETIPESGFRLEFFNLFQLGALALLGLHPPFTKDISSNLSSPQLLIVGFGRMGQSLVTSVAAEWYDSHYESNGPLKITVVDRDVDKKLESLRFNHPQVTQFIHFVPRQIDVFSADFQRGDFLFDDERNCQVTNAYICLDNDAVGLYAGLSLLQQLKDQNVSVVVRMTYDGGLAALLREPVKESGFNRLHSFNLLDQTCTEQLLVSGMIESLAQAIHYDYVRHQHALGQTLQSNPSMAPWDELPESFRESNRLQVEHLKMKVTAVGCGITPVSHDHDGAVEFSAEEIEKLAEMEHERWKQDNLSRGWKPGGEQKDSEKKSHPLLVSWNELSTEHKELNRQTIRGIPDLLNRAGYRLYRR
jgi:hypothetical protein